MKARFTSVILGLLFISSTQAWSQRRVTVEAVNDDISYYLDLKAVAYIFGESEALLEDFGYKLNDPDKNISSLDLNGDGFIDYLRVIESTERNVHLVVIQAVLDKNIYQDVATIAVGKSEYNQVSIQVIGDPYLYGYNYIIDPYYYRTPLIVRWFWSHYYTRWHSPYYWGYYPHNFRHRNPLEINIYLGYVHRHIYSVNNHYRYSDNYRFRDFDRMHNSIRRNDFERNHPDKSFSNRNKDIRNRRNFDNDDRDFKKTHENGYNRGSYENRDNRNNAGNRGNQRGQNDNYQRENRNENSNYGNRENKNYNPGSRDNNQQNRPSTNNNSGDNRNKNDRNVTPSTRDYNRNNTQVNTEQRPTRPETRETPRVNQNTQNNRNVTPQNNSNSRTSTPSTTPRTSSRQDNERKPARSSSDNNTNNTSSRR